MMKDAIGLTVAWELLLSLKIVADTMAAMMTVIALETEETCIVKALTRTTATEMREMRNNSHLLVEIGTTTEETRGLTGSAVVLMTETRTEFI